VARVWLPKIEGGWRMFAREVLAMTGHGQAEELPVMLDCGSLNVSV